MIMVIYYYLKKIIKIKDFDSDNSIGTCRIITSLENAHNIKLDSTRIPERYVLKKDLGKDIEKEFKKEEKFHQHL